MNAEQRAAMRKLAEEATPGPWWHGECTPPDGHALAWMGQSFVDCEGGQKNYAAPSRDAEYIAAANPATILQLLDYVDSLERDAARYLWLRDATGETPLRPAAFNSEFCPDQRLKFDFPTLVSFDCIGNQIDLDAAIDAAMQGEME